MERWARKLAVVLAAGYILFFYSALILPPLLLACAYGLRRNQSREHQPDLVEVVLGHIPPRACLPLVLMPATAIAIYSPVALLGLTLPTNWILYVITMPLGFFFLIRSLWILHRGKLSPKHD